MANRTMPIPSDDYRPLTNTFAGFISSRALSELLNNG